MWRHVSDWPHDLRYAPRLERCPTTGQVRRQGPARTADGGEALPNISKIPIGAASRVSPFPVAHQPRAAFLPSSTEAERGANFIEDGQC